MIWLLSPERVADPSLILYAPIRVWLDELSYRIQKRESDARNTVEWLVELGVVEGVGNGRARRYMLSSKMYALSGNEAGHTRQHGMTTLQEKDIILRHLESFSRISRADVVELCRCDSNHAYYLLKLLLQDGKIKKIPCSPKPEGRRASIGSARCGVRRIFFPGAGPRAGGLGSSERP